MKRFWLWATAYALAILSAAWASRYGFKAADTDLDALIRGGALAAVSIFAVHSLAWAHRTHHAGSRFAGWCIGIAGVLCFVVALAGGVGNLALTTDRTAGQRASAIELGEDARRDAARIEAELASLPRHRPAATVRPLIETARAHERYRSSVGCVPERITLAETREHCAYFRGLEAELGAAERAADLAANLARIRAAKAKAGPTIDADPHGATLSRILRGWIDARTASSWYALGVSLALELAAMAAMLAAEITTRPAQQAERREPGGGSKALPVPAGNVIDVTPLGRVEQFLADAAEPQPGTEVKVAQLYPIYLAWCDERGREALAPPVFEREFARVAAKVGISTFGVGEDLYAADLKVMA